MNKHEPKVAVCLFITWILLLLLTFSPHFLTILLVAFSIYGFFNDVESIEIFYNNLD